MSQAQYLDGYDDGYAAGKRQTVGGVPTTTLVKTLMIAEVDGELCYVKRPPYEGLPLVSVDEFESQNKNTKIMQVCPPPEYYDTRPLGKSDVIEKIKYFVRYSADNTPLKIIDITSKVAGDPTPVVVCAYVPYTPLNSYTRHDLAIKLGNYCWIITYEPGGTFMMLSPGVHPECLIRHACPNLREMAAQDACAPGNLERRVFDPTLPVNIE